MSVMPYAPILDSDAVVDPGAVVVKDLDALVALAAVLGPHRANRLARVADVVDGIVNVVVVPPGCRVAYLY